MHFPFVLSVVFSGCSQTKRVSRSSFFSPMPVKSETTSKKNADGEEFRKILYDSQYPIPILAKLHFDPSLFAQSLIPLLSMDPELWGLILEVFFLGWNHRVSAILTFLCRKSSEQCLKFSTLVVAKILDEDNSFESIIVALHNKPIALGATEFDKTILWLNGYGLVDFRDSDVFFGVLRFIISEEYHLNGFICLRWLETKIKRFPNREWIGGGELKLEGIVASDILKCQQTLFEMNEKTREKEIYDITHSIGRSAIIAKDNTFATGFKKIIYTSTNARDDLGALFKQWGEKMAIYILTEILERSIHVDSFLWEFAFFQVLRQTARGSLTARLTISCSALERLRRDAYNMASLLVLWALRRTGPDDVWWTNRKEEWHITYIEGESIHWDELSYEETVMYWINGGTLPPERKLTDKIQVVSIINDIVERQIGSNGAICAYLLDPADQIPEERGDKILQCQRDVAAAIVENPGLISELAKIIANYYFAQRVY